MEDNLPIADLFKNILPHFVWVGKGEMFMSTVVVRLVRR